MKNSSLVFRIALATLGATACGGGGDSTGTNGVVQLVSVTSITLTVSCGHLNNTANPDTLYLVTHLVNTTAADVAIDSIGSIGTIIRASNQANVGQTALNYTSVPYHPAPALLQARTGDITLTVSEPATALCAGQLTPLDYKDVSLNIRVTTAAGQFVSAPLTVHMVVN